MEEGDNTNRIKLKVANNGNDERLSLDKVQIVYQQ